MGYSILIPYLPYDVASDAFLWKPVQNYTRIHKIHACLFTVLYSQIQNQRVKAHLLVSCTTDYLYNRLPVQSIARTINFGVYAPSRSVISHDFSFVSH